MSRVYRTSDIDSAATLKQDGLAARVVKATIVGSSIDASRDFEEPPLPSARYHAESTIERVRGGLVVGYQLFPGTNLDEIPDLYRAREYFSAQGLLRYSAFPYALGELSRALRVVFFGSDDAREEDTTSAWAYLPMRDKHDVSIGARLHLRWHDLPQRSLDVKTVERIADFAVSELPQPTITLTLRRAR